jgi:hypothetical protein
MQSEYMCISVASACAGLVSLLKAIAMAKASASVWKPGRCPPCVTPGVCLNGMHGKRRRSSSRSPAAWLWLWPGTYESLRGPDYRYCVHRT